VVTSRKLTIFEGPDGAGKSTAAQEFALKTGAKYVHFGPLNLVDKGLGRMYIEAMLPALLGYQDVVFDRCWLSEIPYGEAFRGGKNRLPHSYVRMLERVAMRCQTVVVLCQPSWETVVGNYKNRKGLEMLENEDQLQLVYDLYLETRTSLPWVRYDYTTHPNFDPVALAMNRLRSEAHPLTVASAGTLHPEVIIVGESAAERKEHDNWHQYPFVSFSHQGCSAWLTDQIEAAGVPEDKILWANADQDLTFLTDSRYIGKKFITLGSEAYQKLQAGYALKSRRVPHPQSWKRFNHNEPYPLIEHLRSLT
jgi:thymidylate kinase